MSADLLRKAAATLRDRATVSSRTAPWAADGCQVTGGEGQWMLMATTSAYDMADGPDDEGDDQLAAYIATMHPGVGLALAAWLDSVARVDLGRSQRETHSHCDGDCDVLRAMNVAILIVGEQS